MEQPIFRPVGLATVGVGVHRSGWPYVMRALQPFLSQHAPVILDDYVERTFLFYRNRHVDIRHSSPWIGICHHPVQVPAWYGPNGLRNLETEARWQASFPQLRLVVTLDEARAMWIRDNWRVPCLSLRHPTARPSLKWSMQRFLANPDKQILQVGSFLRNTQAIYQVGVPGGLRKVHLLQAAGWIEMAHERCKSLFPARRNVGTVARVNNLSDADYDRALSENIVFVELIDAVANNTILECIARNTPILVNRLKGPEYYLGRNYPLFYDDIGEVEGLLTESAIASAHDYLRGMDKTWLRGDSFAQSLVRGCREAVPELWAPARS